MADKIATRQAYGEALSELGETNPKIVVLDADLSGSTKTAVFGKKFPDRFFNCGIAEANMICIAAGFAASGYIPFASSFAMFATGRAFEQVRNSVGYTSLNVKIAASHGGITVGEDGASHQCCEDFGLMGLIPGMTVISPADAVEAKAAVYAAAKYVGPVYMRFGRSAVPVIYDPKTYTFRWGKGDVLADGRDVSIVANGITVGMALEARKLLENEGISARVITIHTIKPIDRDIILKAASDTGAIVTAEEHSVLGGLGCAVSHVVVTELPVPVLKIGMQDVFGRSGTVPELLEFYGITPAAIAAKAKAAVALKKKL